MNQHVQVQAFQLVELSINQRIKQYFYLNIVATVQIKDSCTPQQLKHMYPSDILMQSIVRYFCLLLAVLLYCASQLIYKKLYKFFFKRDDHVLWAAKNEKCLNSKICLIWSSICVVTGEEYALAQILLRIFPILTKQESYPWPHFFNTNTPIF